MLVGLYGLAAYIEKSSDVDLLKWNTADRMLLAHDGEVVAVLLNFCRASFLWMVVVQSILHLFKIVVHSSD